MVVIVRQPVSHFDTWRSKCYRQRREGTKNVEARKSHHDFNVVGQPRTANRVRCEQLDESGQAPRSRQTPQYWDRRQTASQAPSLFRAVMSVSDAFPAFLPPRERR